MRPVRSRRHLRAKTAGGVALAALATLVLACSLGNVHQDDCKSDSQCATAFGAGSKCSSGYCTTPNNAGCQKKGADGRACFSCVPEVTADFENACTGATCAPFDSARLTKLEGDGSLPPLP